MKIKPKKSLGQNFLIDKNILNLIVELGTINEKDVLLEVGPGTGNLTEQLLLRKPEKLIVVEKDGTRQLTEFGQFIKDFVIIAMRELLILVNNVKDMFLKNSVNEYIKQLYGGYDYNIEIMDKIKFHQKQKQLCLCTGQGDLVNWTS